MAYRRRRARPALPTRGEVVIHSAFPGAALPAATVARAARALPAPRATPHLVPVPAPAPPVAPGPSPEVAAQALTRAVELAMMRAAQATAQTIESSGTRAAQAMAQAIERATAKGVEVAFKAVPERRMPDDLGEVVRTAVTQGVLEAGALFYKETGEPAVKAFKGILQELFSPVVPPMLRTYTLPWMGDPKSEAVRVASAGDRPYEVVVRTVAPPGSFAIFSFDANEMNMRGVPVVAAGTSAIPAGDFLVIPGGQFQIVRLSPKMGLFAKGNIGPGAVVGDAVICSVTGAAFVAAFGGAPSPMVVG